MGSQSDYKTMRLAGKTLKKIGVSFETKIISAHRTPKRMYEFASAAEKNNIGVIIAGAGGSAHLPGMIAALTSLPVLGVPIESKKLKGSGTITFNSDSAGKEGDVRDVIIKLDSSEIGFSLNNRLGSESKNSASNSGPPAI